MQLSACLVGSTAPCQSLLQPNSASATMLLAPDTCSGTAQPRLHLCSDVPVDMPCSCNKQTQVNSPRLCLFNPSFYPFNILDRPIHHYCTALRVLCSPRLRIKAFAATVTHQQVDTTPHTSPILHLASSGCRQKQCVSEARAKRTMNRHRDRFSSRSSSSRSRKNSVQRT